MKDYWPYVMNQRKLEEKLQELHQAEKDGTIGDPKVRERLFGTKKERKREARRVSLAVERFIKREKAYDKKVKKLSVGTY